MKIQIATLVVLLSVACSSRSGLRATRDASADVDTGAGAPAADVGLASAAEASSDAMPPDSPDAAAMDGAAQEAGSGEETLDADHDDADAPTDSMALDLQGMDALASPCGVSVTGSCLIVGSESRDCTDYTDTDLAVPKSKCNEVTGYLVTWSTQPCQDRFTVGCLTGTPGTSGCQVDWSNHGAQYLTTCSHYGGTPVSP